MSRVRYVIRRIRLSWKVEGRKVLSCFLGCMRGSEV